MQKPRLHKHVTNESNPKDRNSRGNRKVRDEASKGNVSTPAPRQKGMGRKRPLPTPGRDKK